MSTVQIELVGGPADGARVEVPDDTALWVVTQPAMTAAEFIAMENAPPLMEFARRKEREHAYASTRQFAASGARRFRYMGERVAK